VLWDRATGTPVARAIVWQDRRTTDFCREHEADRSMLQQKTGLILDPYFSATKIRWLLHNDPTLRTRAEAGKIAFGTIDTFLLWRLTGGQRHSTDASNASRTLLFNLHNLKWDAELCRYFSIPEAILPTVHQSASDFGSTKGLSFLPDGIPIRGIAGDQQAALFGQGAFSPGEGKCTYGTGAFFLVNIGTKPLLSRHQLVTTVAATTDQEPRYALEGSVFVAGAAIQWLRDGLKLFSESPQSEALAMQSDPSQPVIFVPAFVGLGAPYWVPEARGAIFGITRGTTGAEIARAALEGVAFEVFDLIEAASKDGTRLESLRVDGGMARNDWFLQYQADILALPVSRSPFSESTALGAAMLASVGLGMQKSESDLKKLVAESRRFEPRLPEGERQSRLQHWRRAIDAVRGMS
jgi:glycerol kinase